MSLIPTEELPILRINAALQYDTTILWYPQRAISGQPATDRYGKPAYLEPVTLPARIVSTLEQFFDAQGRQQVATETIYIPPKTGVLAGDKLILPDGDPDRPPPILSVSSVPDEANAIYDVVRTGRA